MAPRRRPPKKLRRPKTLAFPYLDRLPAEIILMIFEAIHSSQPHREQSILSMTPVRLVCKRFHAIATSLAYRSIVLTPRLISAEGVSRFAASRAHISRYTRHIVFGDGCCFGDQTRLRGLVEGVASLESVTFACWYPRKFRSLVDILLRALLFRERGPLEPRPTLCIETWERQPKPKRTGYVRIQNGDVQRIKLAKLSSEEWVWKGRRAREREERKETMGVMRSLREAGWD